LKELKAIRTLSLANNKLKTPILDVSNLQELRVLHLGGNPLEYFPELSHANKLHICSLATVLFAADEGFSSWTVDFLKVQTRVPMRSWASSADDVLALLLSRSSLQHPLIMGGLAEMAKDVDTRKSMIKADRLLPQLVHAVLSENVVVAAKACETIELLSVEPDVAEALERAAVMSAAEELVSRSESALQIAAMKVTFLLSVHSIFSDSLGGVWTLSQAVSGLRDGKSW
jgi:hypothetical protein